MASTLRGVRRRNVARMSGGSISRRAVSRACRGITMGADKFGVDPLEIRQLLAGTGLTGIYYNNPAGSNTNGAEHFTTVALVRTDPTVDFNFGGGSPAPSVQIDDFTGRWLGYFQAPSTAD